MESLADDHNSVDARSVMDDTMQSTHHQETQSLAPRRHRAEGPAVSAVIEPVWLPLSSSDITAGGRTMLRNGTKNPATAQRAEKRG